MTFSPLGSAYHELGSPGSYVSMTSSLQAYKYYYDLMEDLDGVYKQYLLLAMLYDFMAFTAQLYSRMLQDFTRNLKNLNAVRDTLFNCLNCLHTIGMSEEFSDLVRLFKIIAKTSMPLPPTPSTSDSSPLPSRSRPREPSSAVLQTRQSDDPVLKKPRRERLHTMPFGLLLAEAPVPLPKQSIDLRSPDQLTKPSGGGEKHNPSDDSDSNLNFFCTVPMNAVTTSATKFVMDSGAGKCGTSDLTLLSNVQLCKDITVSGAFGPSTVPTHSGSFGPLNLDAVHIKGMGSQTLVSLSQFCAGGTTGQKFIGVFTPTEYRMYDMLTALPILADLAKHGLEAERGSVQNGIYVRESS